MGAIPSIRDFDEPKYDPFLSDELSFGTHADPYRLYAAMRARGPVHPGGYRFHLGLQDAIYSDTPAFTVVGHKEVLEVLMDMGTFSNKAYEANIGTSFGKTITAMDAPEHTRYRRIFQKIFLPQFVVKWGETIVDPVVDRLMAKFLPTGEADLVEDFTILYPFHVIYEQLNLPKEDIVVFQRLALGQSDFVTPGRAIEAGDKLGEYFSKLVAARREQPGDDLITLLAQTEVDGEYLPEEVLVSFLRQLMNAGGDTTYRGTSVLLTALLQNPDQLDAVRQDRSLIPQAIEEALRWDGPVGMQTRLAIKDARVGGVDIPAGSLVYAVAASANRDPDLWEDPDTFDIFRQRRAHYAFGRGAHICVGQHLARVEMTRALGAILDRMPDLRINPDKPLPELRGGFMRVPKHIHVRFTPPA